MKKSLIIFLLLSANSMVLFADDESQIVGTKAQEWIVSDWIQSSPLSLKGLSGKVLLVRWWTDPYCPYCTASAPALNEWYDAYKDKGLIVVGLYHHKSSTPLEIQKVKEYSTSLGFKFPVAIDKDWITLKKWWLNKNLKARWTSVSFLIDRNGIIRYIHPGGQYVNGDDDYARLKSRIEELLTEKPEE
jgi:peroxiredoxin